MTHGSIDPAQQWSDLLSSLPTRRRDAVVAALRSSAQQGWPADREAVRLLVAYANGEINAQQYADGIVASMGGHPGAQSPLPSRPVAPAQSWTPEPEPVVAPAPAPQQPRLTREEAVAAYVSGRISVEEFLRITRGVSA